MAIGPPWSFRASQPAKPGYGLFSVAPPVDAPERVAFGVEIESEICGGGDVWRSTCPPTGGTKNKFQSPISGPTVAVLSDAFQVYAIPDCSLVGLGADGVERKARLALERSAELLVEQEFQDLLVANVGPAETLTSGAVPIHGAVAMLECWLKENYAGGVGVIHAPAGVASYAARDRQIVERNSVLETWIGTPFAFNGGFCTSIGPDGTPAAAGNAWLYATGQVWVWRGSLTLTGPDGYMDGRVNDAAILAEQTWAVGYECGAAAAQVCLTGACA